MFPASMTIAGFDPELAAAIDHERVRQEDHIELIASENYASPSVLEAQGSVLTNKYAEGYPGKRYYGGCECVDLAEQLAIDRAKQLFGAEFVNVQPHSGAQANFAVLLAAVKPGETIMGLAPGAGGPPPLGTLKLPPPSPRYASHAQNPSLNHLPMSKGANRILFVRSKARLIGSITEMGMWRSSVV